MGIALAPFATARMGRGGLSQGSQGAGLFPNSAPAFLPMRQVYPAPSGVTPQEYHQWAYYDGTNPMQYRMRVGVSFGRWPYIYKLVSGPPGMAFGQTVWNTAWDGQGTAAYLAGYGILTWTPAAAVTNELVSVDVTDQDGNVLNIQWNISTSSSISQFCFVNADSGSDTSGTGAITAPWQTLTKAYGTSYSAVGAAPPGSIVVMRGASNKYAMPGWTDSPTTPNYAQLSPTTKPLSLIGFPGENAVIDLSTETTVPISGDVSGPTSIILFSGSGFTCRDFTISGYNTAGANLKLLQLVAAQSRWTFQGVNGLNTGCGTDSTNNSSMFWTGGGYDGASHYIFITGTEETNRQSYNQANNTPLWKLYNGTDVLTELCYENSPNSLFGGDIHYKSDISYGCNRANLVVQQGGQGYFVDVSQAPYQGYGNVEFCYNVGVNTGSFRIPQLSYYTWSPGIACYRNNVSEASDGAAQPFVSDSSTSNLTAPYTSVSAQYGMSIAAISSASAGGSLSAQYYAYGITTLGVSGESSIGNSNGGSIQTIQTTGSTSVVTVPWLPIPPASGYRIYRGIYVPTEAAGTGDGTTTIFPHTLAGLPVQPGTVVVTAGSVTGKDNSSGAISGTGISGTINYTTGALSVTYTTAPASGTAITVAYIYAMTQYAQVSSGSAELIDNGSLTWTGGSPPTTNTALSSARFIYNSNIVQTPLGALTIDTGPSITTDGKNISVNSGQLNSSTGLLLVSNGGTVGAQLA